ncbi:MAG: hypothetical protein GEU82_13675 [Luteitalea sp.]|nr:hypothetical protein [Luteitalea sp.]
MRVRWTREAADDLQRICDDIAQSRPESARRVAQTVVQRIGTLESFPHIGRPGRPRHARDRLSATAIRCGRGGRRACSRPPDRT